MNDYGYFSWQHRRPADRRKATQGGEKVQPNPGHAGRARNLP